ncbi:hypothetical protein NX059_010763 [Plenodomus lindquistii]|nr:hypothetical protein NX059_010763 [Plenodomus lindquistii]
MIINQNLTTGDKRTLHHKSTFENSADRGTRAETGIEKSGMGIFHEAWGMYNSDTLAKEAQNEDEKV